MRGRVMPFAAGLRESLYLRHSQIPLEISRGDSLEHVLNRHLLAVEEMGEGNIVTSILLLSDDGKSLSHGAAPNLPQSYRDAIDGLGIGPRAGSCGTATVLGRPIYVSDIAADPLWEGYRDLALPHGLRSCWSTPIRDEQGSVIGSFAIYHRTVGGPTREEVNAINMIAAHVAEAIMWAREFGQLESAHPEVKRPRLRLVKDEGGDDRSAGMTDRLTRNLDKLQGMAGELERLAESSSDESAAALRAAAEDFRRLIDAIQRGIGPRGLPLD